MLPLRTILCPVDFSEPSNKALDVAMELAAELNAELLLLHVVPAPVPPIPADASFTIDDGGEYEDAMRVTAEQQLTLTAQGIAPEIRRRNVISNGDAADEIAR